MTSDTRELKSISDVERLCKNSFRFQYRQDVILAVPETLNSLALINQTNAETLGSVAYDTIGGGLGWWFLPEDLLSSPKFLCDRAGFSIKELILALQALDEANRNRQ